MYSDTNTRTHTVIARARTHTLQVAAYRIHLEQFDVARKAIKRHEANIVPGRMVLYRDFVNQHNFKGAKVNSLEAFAFWDR